MTRVAPYLLVLCAAARLAAQAPMLISISPQTVTAGSGAFTLTATGSFPVNSRIVWNEDSLTTASNSGSALLAAVPAGLVALSGTATVRVASPEGAMSAALTITIAPRMTLLTAPVLPPATQGRLYSQAVTVAGGSPPYRFVLTRGVLPIGVSLDGNTGAIAGLPASEGTHEFTIQVSDAANTMLSRQFSLGVFRELAIVSTALPRAITGIAYSFGLLAAGGSMPYSNWQVAGGALPPGIALSSGGYLAGAATAPGAYQFTVRLRDNAGLTATRILTLEVAAALSLPPAPPFPAMTAGAAFSYRLTPEGGSAPFLFAVAGGQLPPGLRLDTGEGTITGAVTAPGSWRPVIQVTDAVGQTARVTLALEAIDALAFTTAPALSAAAGSNYSVALSAAGGTPPYRFAITAGALPAGITMDAAGGLSGAVSQPGVSTFTAAVADSAGRTASRTFTFTASLPPAPRLTISAPVNLDAASQTRITLTLDAAYPVEVSGTLALAAAEAPDDPTALFSNGRRNTSFRFAPGETAAQWEGAAALSLQSGTTAGALTLSATMQAAGSSLTPEPVRHTLYVQNSAPVIRSARLAAISGGFEVVVTGYTPSRELGEALFRFEPASGETLDTPELKLPLRAMAAQWFGSPDSAPFGSQFTYRQTFQFAGPLSTVGAVRVAVTNSIGESEPIPAER